VRPAPRGDEFRRYTYDDVVETPRLMLAELHALLSERVTVTPGARSAAQVRVRHRSLALHRPDTAW
jgi:hypothetical protein